MAGPALRRVPVASRPRPDEPPVRKASRMECQSLVYSRFLPAASDLALKENTACAYVNKIQSEHLVVPARRLDLAQPLPVSRARWALTNEHYRSTIVTSTLASLTA